jgi:hypothetical protein
MINEIQNKKIRFAFAHLDQIKFSTREIQRTVRYLQMSMRSADRELEQKVRHDLRKEKVLEPTQD